MTPPAHAPICRIIAGPNGSGKTTFALNWLRTIVPASNFVNADLIAAGLSPLAPHQQLIAASRLFLRQIERHISQGKDFAFETTLSGRGHLGLVRRLRAAGWYVELFYLALPNIELSRLRVAERVAHGGHAIAEADIVRRFPRSLRNLFDTFAGEVDYLRCLLNSGSNPALIFVQQGTERTIFDQSTYDHLVRESRP